MAERQRRRYLHLRQQRCLRPSPCVTHREAAADAVRRRRLSLLGAITAGVLVAVVVIALATGGGGSSSPPNVGSSAARTTESEVNALLTGIPQRANVLGSPSAPVRIEYFGDLECSACQAFTRDSLPTLMSRWVRTGKVRVEYRSLETATRDPEVFKLQQVAGATTEATRRTPRRSKKTVRWRTAMVSPLRRHSYSVDRAGCSRSSTSRRSRNPANSAPRSKAHWPANPNR
jgi:hypothetical protein